jgi:hypothetical protein
MIPLNLGESGASVTGGVVWSSETGVLRYQPDESTKTFSQGNPQLALTLKALSNYHYKTLTVSLSYIPDGTLSLTLALRGFNPDLNKDQAINVNLNVEQNLLSLLNSLSLSSRLEESLVRSGPGKK